MFELLIGATALVCAAAIALGAWGYRDTLHPLVYLAAFLAVLYVGYPAYLLAGGGLQAFIDDESLVYVQTIYLAGTVAMLLGTWAGAGRQTPISATVSAPPPADPGRLRNAAFVLGLVGVGGFGYGIANVGGFDAAFGRGYGTGWSDVGYVRELYLLTLPALLWLMVTYQSERPTARAWAAIALISSPLLMQGLLGARRGPTFMALVGLGSGWYLMRRVRPRLATVVAGGALVGFFLLFLVANRRNIYLGSDFQLESTTPELLTASAGNEYIYGSAILVYAQRRGTVYWGGRYAQLFLVRPIPKQLWPTKYQDASRWLDAPNVEAGNIGLPIYELSSVLGWMGAYGAAPGVIADMWVEFSWLALVALFGVGWLYGRTWRNGVVRGGAWAVWFGVSTALSIYLIMQNVEAWGFRLLIMLLGSIAVARWGGPAAIVRGTERSTDSANAPAGA